MTFRFSEAADQRVLAAYQRLPAWQQHVLGPLMMSAYVATMWPTPIAMGLVAAFYAFLKIAYAPEAAFDPEWLSWSQLGWLLTGPFWLPIAFGYPMMIWAGIGIIPRALIAYHRHLRERRPFALHDPAIVLNKETRTRLKQGKLLIDEDIRAIKVRSDLDNLRIILDLKIIGTCLLVSCLFLTIIYLFFSRLIPIENAIPVAILFCFATLIPNGAEGNDYPELWCGNCRQRIFDKHLQHLIEFRTCPHCSGPAQVVGRRPGRMSGSLWDAEVP